MKTGIIVALLCNLFLISQIVLGAGDGVNPTSVNVLGFQNQASTDVAQTLTKYANKLGTNGQCSFHCNVPHTLHDKEPICSCSEPVIFRYFEAFLQSAERCAPFQQAVASSVSTDASLSPLAKQALQFCSAHCTCRRDVLKGNHQIVLYDSSSVPQLDIAATDYSSVMYKELIDQVQTLQTQFSSFNTATKGKYFLALLSAYNFIKNAYFQLRRVADLNGNEKDVANIVILASKYLKTVFSLSKRFDSESNVPAKLRQEISAHFKLLDNRLNSIVNEFIWITVQNVRARLIVERMKKYISANEEAAELLLKHI
jgi:hypothetical protein